jgi:hypothetical protein
MKTMIVAALTALTLGMGVASAQGLPVGASPQVYGSAWAANAQTAERAQNNAVQAQAGQPKASTFTTAPSARPAAGG